MYVQGKCQNQVFYEIVIPGAPRLVLWYCTVIPHHQKNLNSYEILKKKTPEQHRKQEIRVAQRLEKITLICLKSSQV